jgi:hypothetical protein
MPAGSVFNPGDEMDTSLSEKLLKMSRRMKRVAMLFE